MVIVRDPGRWALDRPASEWEDWLQKTNEFGNPEKAAALIQEIISGMRYAVQKFTGIAWNRFETTLCFPVHRNVNLGYTAYLPGIQKICVTHEFFDAFESVPWTQMIELRSGTFMGLPPDLAFLMGVEETDHAIFHKEQPALMAVTTEMSSLIAHDAQPIEFRALERIIIAAEKHRMPAVTIQHLQTRLLLARSFRNNAAPH